MDKEKYMELVNMIHSNNPDTVLLGKQQMVESLYGYIYHIIEKYFPSFMKDDREILFNEGVCGILENIDSFNPEKGTPMQYFKYSIIHNCSHYIDQHYNQTSSYYRKKVVKIKKAIEFFESVGIEYTIHDIATRCEFSDDVVIELLQMDNRQSVQSSAHEYEISASDHNLPLNQIIEAETREELIDAINQLNEKEKEVITYRFYKNMKFKEIGEKMGISTVDAQNSVQKGLRHLRKNKKLIHQLG